MLLSLGRFFEARKNNNKFSLISDPYYKSTPAKRREQSFQVERLIQIKIDGRHLAIRSQYRYRWPHPRQQTSHSDKWLVMAH